MFTNKVIPARHSESETRLEILQNKNAQRIIVEEKEKEGKKKKKRSFGDIAGQKVVKRGLLLNQ